ncbi:MAG: hypothetical protein EOO45_05555 [Flavobacterium sp.]|nr:MAG: hypothetical protein EOO45_05555 [Flavobacterium sp.]
MKFIAKIFAFLFLCSFSLSAQTIDTNTYDEKTGQRYIVTRNYRGNKLELNHTVSSTGALYFSAGYQSGKTDEKATEVYFIDLYIVHNDRRLGCLKEYESTATLLLADGTQIECFQISETDCGNVGFQAAFALKSKGSSVNNSMEENFKKLMTTEIVEIKVKTSEKTEKFKIKPREREYLKNHFILVDKTMKVKINNPQK